MPAYLIAFCRGVTDRQRLETYWANVAPTFAGTGAKPLAAYTPFEKLEGPGPVEGVVAIEFPSAEIARRWYTSPAYQAAKQHREGAADFDLVLVEDALDSRRDVDAVAKDVFTIDDDIANIDPDPEPYRIGFGATGVVLPNLLLDFDGAGDSVHGAREFHQRAIAHKLDDPPRMGSDRRVDQFTPQGVQTRESTRLINAHEARVTDHVGRQDRREPPLKALLSHADRSPKLQSPRHYGSLGRVSVEAANVGDGRKQTP